MLLTTATAVPVDEDLRILRTRKLAVSAISLSRYEIMGRENYTEESETS